MKKVAIITCNTLGDALLYMTLANNLKLNGYDVTVYSNFILQLNSWFPDFAIQPYPESESEYDAYDLKIADGKCYLTECDPDHYPQLAEKYSFMKMASFDKRLAAKKRGDDPVDKLSGVVVSKFGTTESMAERIKIMCQQLLGFSHATKENGMRTESDCKKNRYPRRIVLHPESGNPIKNWSAKQFIQLAHALRKKGFEPVFIGSPKEREKWLRLLNGEFDMPLFNSLDEAASFLYESGLMVGNDSGIGHLASSLGVPSMTIHRKRDPHYRWRPGWAKNTLILPGALVKFLPQEKWRACLSVSKVLKTITSQGVVR